MLRAIGKVLVGTVPLVLAGCDNGGYYDNGYGNGYYYDPCARYVSCDQCTPIYGCGWCMYGNGQGICASDPGLCRTQEFSWTWDQKGCAASPDGGATKDGGTEGGAEEGGAACHWPASADTFSASDAGTSGCLPTTGGMLCAASQYTLSCYGTSTPDMALGCAPAT